ncbi:Germin-like protein subfamily 1 member 11 [Striga hermonthica]|uniref:Germin-like protein subfamily 1 member 11 n=1 Tax=Striga hermonthica TaxID=68872 RepID=A0A9N7MRU9_STRHE|nr:Germin-like protein subfamily 1 member 11 [Striga hermonthica]
MGRGGEQRGRWHVWELVRQVLGGPCDRLPAGRQVEDEDSVEWLLSFLESEKGGTKIILKILYWIRDFDLEIGFVTSAPTQVHNSKILKKGDMFVVPVGLLRYFRNGPEFKYGLVGRGQQSKCRYNNLHNGISGAKPRVNAEYLARAYQLDEHTIQRLQLGAI